MLHRSSNTFPNINWLSGLYGHASVALVSSNDVNFNRDDVNSNFVAHVWQVEHTLNIVLNHSISNKICFNVSNAPLKTFE